MLANNWDEFPLLLSVQETAEILRVNPATVYSMLKQDTAFPKVLVGKNYKISRDGLRRMIEGTN